MDQHDKLREPITQTINRLSHCPRENPSLSHRSVGFERCREQLSEIHEAERSPAVLRYKKVWPMPQERLEALRLPKALQGEIDDLVRALGAAHDKVSIEREGEMQIAFILGLEKTKRLRPADIESLYIIFDDAVQERLRQLVA